MNAIQFAIVGEYLDLDRIEAINMFFDILMIMGGKRKWRPRGRIIVK